MAVKITKIVKPIIKPGSKEFIKAGATVKNARPGTLLMLVGSGFGKNPDKVSIDINGSRMLPYPIPLFGDSFAIFTMPFIGPDKVTLSLSVGNQQSNTIQFKALDESAPSAPAGEITQQFFNALDALSSLTAEELVTLEKTVPVDEPVLLHLADSLRATREEIQIIREQVAMGATFERQATDKFVKMMGVTPIIQDILFEFRAGGPTTRIRDLQQISEAQQIVGDGAIAIGDSISGIAGELGKLIGGGIKEVGRLYRTTGRATNMIVIKHVFENAKLDGRKSNQLQRGIELKLEYLMGVPGSDDAIRQLRKELEELAKDYEKKAKEFEDQANAVDADQPGKAETLRESARDYRGRAASVRTEKNELNAVLQNGLTLSSVNDKLDKLEIKGDKGAQTLKEIVEKLKALEGDIKVLEAKADKTHTKLDTSISNQEKMEVKLDVIGTKLDEHGAALVKVEGKADKAESKLDEVGVQVNSAHKKLDKLEGKTDKAEKKLDKLEKKADKLEGKADKAEKKLDKLEGKADKAEKKLDKLEKKADKLEGKADKAEKKLDKLEGKADKAEKKLDKLEQKFDSRVVRPVPSESSVAHQEGGGNVTSAVVALRADNNVFLKAFVHKNPAWLDRKAHWSRWINFRKPSNAAAITEVSIDLQYSDAPSVEITGIITVRDVAGKIFMRSFESKRYNRITQPSRWSAWREFLGQP